MKRFVQVIPSESELSLHWSDCLWFWLRSVTFYLLFQGIIFQMWFFYVRVSYSKTISRMGYCVFVSYLTRLNIYSQTQNSVSLYLRGKTVNASITMLTSSKLQCKHDHSSINCIIIMDVVSGATKWNLVEVPEFAKRGRLQKISHIVWKSLTKATRLLFTRFIHWKNIFLLGLSLSCCIAYN